VGSLRWVAKLTGCQHEAPAQLFFVHILLQAGLISDYKELNVSLCVAGVLFVVCPVSGVLELELFLTDSCSFLYERV